MKDKLKISLIQADIVWENIDANLSKYSFLLGKVDNDTDIVVLPEMFSTGFTMEAEKFAEDFNGKTISWMKKSASTYNFVITGSLIFSEKNKIYNRLVWMDPSGSFAFYDKRHLFRMGMENSWYTPGKSKLIIEFRGWKICPLICYDLRFPVWSRNTDGYDLLIYVANWPHSRTYAWNSLLRARAIENQCYIVAVNRVGKDGTGTKYSGESMILDPAGIVLNGLDKNKESIISTTISMEVLNDYRREFPVGKDADNFKLII